MNRIRGRVRAPVTTERIPMLSTLLTVVVSALVAYGAMRLLRRAAENARSKKKS